MEPVTIPAKCEMFICEIEHLFLHPDQLYIFRVRSRLRCVLDLRREVQPSRIQKCP